MSIGRRPHFKEGSNSSKMTLPGLLIERRWNRTKFTDCSNEIIRNCDFQDAKQEFDVSIITSLHPTPEASFVSVEERIRPRRVLLGRDFSKLVVMYGDGRRRLLQFGRGRHPG